MSMAIAVELAEVDRGAGFQIDDGGLAGIAPGVFRQQVGDRLIGNLELMIAERARHHSNPGSTRASLGLTRR